jgi:hemerythrin
MRGFMVDYLIWKDEYSVSNSAIDLQHQQIIRLLNSVFDLIKNGGSVAQLNNLLDDLQLYAETHFKFEEKMMEMAGFPELKEHAAVHKTMADRTAAMGRTHRTSINEIMPQDVLAFLKEWWLNHILIDDMKYAPYVSNLSMQD